MNRTAIIRNRCTGPNSACRAAHRAGRSVHITPLPRPDQPALVMPTYHYATIEEGVAAIERAKKTAPTVRTDADLYAYRAQGIPHFLPVGWVDPSRR